MKDRTRFLVCPVTLGDQCKLPFKPRYNMIFLIGKLVLLGGYDNNLATEIMAMGIAAVAPVRIPAGQSSTDKA